MVFYVFLSFITHPDVMTGRIVHNARAEMNQVLMAAEVIVLVFSFVFILYSTTAFVRARKKEFGLLTLMGMTQRQMRRMVFLENGLIAGAALAIGLALGVLFSKLFLLAAAALAGDGQRMPFAVRPIAIAGTVIAFTGLFLSVNLVSLLGVRASSITELLKAHRGPKHEPKRRPLVLLLGVGLLASGYWLAWVTDARSFLSNALPILGLTIAGTYLTVTQGSVLLFGWLRRKLRLYLRGTNVLVINRLLFRLVDTARVIFVSAILIAVVGSSLGAFNTLVQGAKSLAIEAQPYALSVVLEGTDGATEAESRIAGYLRQAGVSRIQTQTIPYFIAEQQWRYTVVSSTSYNRAAEIIKEFGPAVIGRGEALYIRAYAPDDTAPGPETVDITPAAGVGPSFFRVVCTITRPRMAGGYVVVLSDADFAALWAEAPERRTWLGFEYAGWERHAEIPQEINGVVGGSRLSLVTSRVEIY
jgi:putative ABC transport system permease protein